MKKDYKHGGDITTFAKEIHCHVDEVIDLSSNINFVKPHIEIDFNKVNSASYPNYDKLYCNIAELYKVAPAQIELFNGATSAINSLFRDLNLTECTLYNPCYLEYKRVANLYGYTINSINRFKNIDEELKENALVIFVNPSTPDGKFYNIEKLMKIWMEKNCTILIDESFLDFTPFESAIKYLKRYDKLYILKSMTKFYASAGIRVGAILSNEKNIKTLKAKEPLWKISEFDSQYLQSALEDSSFKERSHHENKREKEFLEEILKTSPLIEKVYPSSANFIMVKLKNITAEALQERVKYHKIMLRNCSNFDGLNNYFVRIAIKEKKKLTLLKNSIDKKY